MKKADRVAATTRSAVVPSLGVQLRMPPGGDVCSLARRISVSPMKGAACMKLPYALVRGLKLPLPFIAHRIAVI
jgi:hypothetical protein